LDYPEIFAGNMSTWCWVRYKLIICSVRNTDIAIYLLIIMDNQLKLPVFVKILMLDHVINLW